MYVIHGQDVVDTLSNVVAQCAVKMTRFYSDSEIFKLNYRVFERDSIPQLCGFSGQPLIYAFECDRVGKKIIKAYLGQHFTFVRKKDLDI
jgi:hypothetical protein